MLRRLAFFLVLVLGAFAAGITLFWFWLAVGVHLSGVPLRLAQGLIILGAAAAAILFVRGRWQRLLAMTAGGIIAAQVWWAFVPVPRDASWAPELAHGVTATLNPDGTVTLDNVRNFVWTTPDTFQAAWETRTVDPARVMSVDVFSSVWGNPYIAHTLVSFGFEDGRHAVFSSEIRRREGQVYSTLGGFVREFPLIVLAADERDVIHLRTDVRGEQVSLFPLTLSQEARTALFMGFVDFVNELAEEPLWYNTITENCTTVPYRIVRSLGDRAPVDWRLILSGKLYEYLHERGVLAPDMSPGAIAERARLPKFGPLPPDGVTYSREIREVWAAQG